MLENDFLSQIKSIQKQWAVKLAYLKEDKREFEIKMRGKHNIVATLVMIYI